MLPGTLLDVYLGALARVGVERGEKTPMEWTMYGVGLLATVGVTVVITRAAKRAMREKGLGLREATDATTA